MEGDELNDTIEAAFDTYFDESEHTYIAACESVPDYNPGAGIIAKFDRIFRFYVEHDRLPTYDELGV